MRLSRIIRRKTQRQVLTGVACGTAVAAMLVGGMAGAAENTGTVQGTITGTGLDADIFEISLWNRNNGYDIAVDSAGSFAKAKVKAGTYNVSVNYSDDENAVYYDDAADKITVTAGGIVTKDIGYVLLDGTVSGNGVPLETGADISTLTTGQDPYWRGTTDDSGRYTTMLAITGASKTVKIQAWPYQPKWAPAWYDGATSEADATPVTLEPGVNRTIDLALPRAANIRGRTKLPKKAIGVDRRVAVFDATGEIVNGADSTRAGVFNVRGLAAGSYTLSVARASGPSLVPGFFYPDIAETEADAAVPIDLEAGEDRKLGALVPPDSGKIKGRIVKGKGSNAGRAKLRVVAVSTTRGVTTRSTITRRNGAYTITGLTPGTYKLFVWNTAYPDPHSKRCHEKKLGPARVKADRTANAGKDRFKAKSVKYC